ncbi:MAG TPA: ATP-binding protein [Mucilaginibacter sp.]|nr:ATP-binding protein [Mucilaginibacter sp.]
MDIEDIILYERECTYVDFKWEEYKGDNKGEFIKDIVAFANADYNGDRYIIIGLKKTATEINFNNIGNPEDGAAIQQRINAAIEPELNVTYCPYQYQGHNLVILTIKNPDKPPYVITKDIINKDKLVRKGECWVRKGERKEIASRKDLDRMYFSFLDKNNFEDAISFVFTESKSDSLNISAAKDFRLPSQSKIEDLEYHINLKEIELAKEQDPYKNPLATYLPTSSKSVFGTLQQTYSYAQNSLIELKNKLIDVKENSWQHDEIYLFQEKSSKVNFTILNSGEEYLQDVMLEIEMPKVSGIFVFDEFLEYPSYNPLKVTPPSFDIIRYPSVKDDEKSYYIREKIGSLKHKIAQSALKVPFRILVTEESIDKRIVLKCTLYAENLKKPITKELTINIINE